MEMYINAFVPDNIRVAILKDGRLEAFFEDFTQDHPTRSNIYIGRVINVEPSLEAGFVEYGSSKHGFLPMSEIVPQAWNRKFDQNKKPRIENVIHRGQLITIQVEKEATDTKGARLTTNLSLAGRYMVLMPFSETRGVSRKIADPDARRECRDIAAGLNINKGAGIIIRTAGIDQNKRALVRDLNFLKRLWKEISRKAKAATSPMLLHAEADLIQRVLRDYYINEIETIWIDDRAALEKAESFFKLFMPRQRRNLKLFSSDSPIFSHFEIESQIEDINQRIVELPSGGSLVIDQTEALVAIDVNSGKLKSQNQEMTAYETNLQAAQEIARQLMLRDLGGIVVIDFIDMVSAAHKKAVERALREALKVGKARHRVGKVSSFGLCTLTRQRLGKSVHLAGQQPCMQCNGAGVVPDPNVASVRLLRRLRAQAALGNLESIHLHIDPELANHFQNLFRAQLLQIEKKHNLRILINLEKTCNYEELKVVQRRDSKPPDPVEPAGTEIKKPKKETTSPKETPNREFHQPSGS